MGEIDFYPELCEKFKKYKFIPSRGYKGRILLQ